MTQKIKAQVIVQNLELIIKDLENSIDSLENNKNSIEAKGIQAKLARAISELRGERISKIESIPINSGQASNQEMKNFLLLRIEDLKDLLDSSDINFKKKFDLLMEITQLRAKISNL